MEKENQEVEVKVCPPGYAWGYTEGNSSEIDDGLEDILIFFGKDSLRLKGDNDV